MPAATSTPVTLDSLDRLLCEELAAVERYAQAIARHDGQPHPALAALEENRHCHRARVPVLSGRIQQLGGLPPTKPGAWGTELPLAGAGSLAAAVTALEEHEDRGVELYAGLVSRVDDETAELLRRELMPAQQRSHDRLTAVQAQLRLGTADPVAQPRVGAIDLS